MQNKKIFFKYLTYLLFALGLFALQFSRGISFTIFGRSPDMFIIYTVTTAMYEGMVCGTAAGFFSSFCICAVRGGFSLGYLLFYPFTGLISGFIIDMDFRKHLLTALLFTCVGSMLYDILAYLLSGIFIGVSFTDFLYDLILSIPANLLPSVPVYFGVKAVYRYFSED